MKYTHLLVMAAALVLAACQTAPQSLLAAKATGESSSFAIASLCSVGSFECDVAPSYARIAGVVHTATFDFQQNRITAAQLQDVVNRGRAAVTKLDGVMATCKQDSYTGRCTGDEAAARAQLAEAKRIVASLR